MSLRQPIFISERGAYRPLIFQGTTVYQAHQQLMRLVDERFGPEHVALFAEPVADPGQDAIDWYSRTPGEAWPLAEAGPEERQAAVATLGRLVSDLASYAQELAASPEASRRSAGEMLQLALQHPDASCLFLVGGQPVLAGWGTAPGASDQAPESLTRYRQVSAGESPEELMRRGAAPPPKPPPPAPPLPPWPPVGRDGCLPRFLWGLLGLVALLALLAWLLPPGCVPGGMLPRGCAGPREGELEVRLSQMDRREQELRAELARLEAELARRRQECAQRPTPTPTPVPTPTPIPLPPTPTPLPTPQPTPTPRSTPTPQPTPTPTPRPTPTPAPAPTPTPTPAPTPTPTPAPQEPLRVSKEDQENKDVRFLKGQWVSDTGLVEENTERPVTMELDIDQNGNGTATIIRENGTRCPAPMRSYFNDKGQLIFQGTQPHFCGDGGKFHPSVVVCQPGADGRAHCQGRHPNGHTYDVGIRRR
ncbi:MAG: hypothetical protein KQJ78_14615 [Deltaproteobacteria bacterium]|nr:hypothetical protein [Deltaproteobacteria bacterium]